MVDLNCVVSKNALKSRGYGLPSGPSIDSRVILRSAGHSGVTDNKILLVSRNVRGRGARLGLFSKWDHFDIGHEHEAVPH